MNKSKQYDTDDENLPLRPVRPRTNSKAQEPKGLNDTFTNVKNTDDENLPLKTLKPKVDSIDTSVRPRANSKVDSIDTSFRPRTNSKAQESKYLKENLTNVNNNYTESDGENLPLRSMVNSEGIEKQSVRPRTNSRAQEPKNLNGIFINTNKSESYDSDDENRNGNFERY